MNFEETQFWVSQLFPAEHEVSTPEVVLPATGRHGHSQPAEPLRLATFSLFDGSDTQDLARRPETVAATLELGRNYLGLVGDNEVDVRVELFAVGYAEMPVAQTVAAAGATVESDPISFAPTPGQVFSAVLSGPLPHLLCVVPYVWSDGVPNVSEEPGSLSVHEGESESASPHGRITTMTQLVPISDSELAVVQEQGFAALLQLLADADADLRDFERAGVV